MRWTDNRFGMVSMLACGLVAASGIAYGQQVDRQTQPTRLRVQPNRQPETQEPQPEQVNPEPGLPPGDRPEDKGDMVSFQSFSEPLELSALVDYVGSTLGINIVVKGDMSGTVTFNAPMDVPKSELLELLAAILEQYDYSISQDQTGIYTIQPRGDTPVTFNGAWATSKILDTGGLRPSGLQTTIETMLGQGGGQLGQPQATSASNIAYIDELGVIVMTGPVRDIHRVEQMIEELRARYLEAHFSRIELEHVAAPVARDRVIQLVGQGTDTMANRALQQPQQRGVPNQPIPTAGGSGGALDNIADRLTVDAQSNALIFRGNDTELAQVLNVVHVIDVPNMMESRQYFAGSAVQQIADLARQRGFGEVITLEDTSQQNLSRQFQFSIPQQQNQNNQQSQQVTGGPVMVVDVRRQSIIYWGTAAQQDELAEWIKLLDVSEDVITLEYYKLSNAKAEDVAQIIQGLITGRTQTAESPLLPNSQTLPQFQPFQFQQNQYTQTGEEAGFAPDPTRVFVIADEANNQVIVKAPKKQQDEFAKLVARLDLRRPQVYLEATIVSVSDSRDFRLAVESQIAAGQYQQQTNFGLSTAGDDFEAPRNVSTGLSGLTSALIRSDMVPFIINAVQTNTDSRILSSPQLLVNDNEQASIAAIEQQPTTSTSQGDNSTITSFQGYEDAGTQLNVTPTISEAGYIRLEYEVTLSSFIGSGANGVPPPKSDNTVTGIATIPSDATIVVGGINVKNNRNTIVKVPLLGDIPIVGNLFRDTNKTNSSSLLYIFITPRIMTDPTFQDLRLLTKGPQATARVEPTIPKLEPSRIELAQPRRTPASVEPADVVKPEDDAAASPPNNEASEPARQERR